MLRPFAFVPFVLAALMPAFVGQAKAAPERVVSINLCTDQLAMLLAAPGQLISVSWLARDPMSSVMAEEAMSYLPNRAQAERIYLMRPDLVLAGSYSNAVTLQLLRRLNVPVAVMPSGTTLKDVSAQISFVANALGRKEQGAQMIAAFEAELAALGADTIGPSAVIYGPNGYSAGEGTISNELLAHAGFRNIGADQGLTGGGNLPLEKLLMANPDFLVTSKPYPGASRAEALLSHPALAALKTGTHLESGPEWSCANPHLLRAARDLHQMRQRFEVLQ